MYVTANAHSIFSTMVITRFNVIGVIRIPNHAR